jgi:hypothetical protein
VGRSWGLCPYQNVKRFLCCWRRWLPIPNLPPVEDAKRRPARKCTSSLVVPLLPRTRDVHEQVACRDLGCRLGGRRIDAVDAVQMAPAAAGGCSRASEVEVQSLVAFLHDFLDAKTRLSGGYQKKVDVAVGLLDAVGSVELEVNVSDSVVRRVIRHTCGLGTKCRAARDASFWTRRDPAIGRDPLTFEGVRSVDVFGEDIGVSESRSRLLEGGDC